MTATTYAVYDVCCALASANHGTLYFAGPKIAKKFLAMGRNTPYKAAQYLFDKGWFKLVKESGRRVDGTHTPTVYKVLDHKQWASEHPGCCVDPLDDWQSNLSPSHPECMDDDEPSHPGDCRPILSASRPILSASRPTRSEQTYKELPIETTYEGTHVCPQPFTPDGTDSILPECDGANAAPAPITGGAPFTHSGTVNSATLPPGYEVREGSAGAGFYAPDGHKLNFAEVSRLFRNGTKE